jgi:hypothetical protein
MIRITIKKFAFPGGPYHYTSKASPYSQVLVGVEIAAFLALAGGSSPLFSLIASVKIEIFIFRDEL